MNRAIANHIKALIFQRPYAGTVAGIVMPVSTKRGKRTIVYAMDNDVLGTPCEDGDLTVMCPDASKNSIFYFEDRGGVIVEKTEGGFQHNRCTLTLVGWLNLARLGYDSSQCAWGYLIYKDILNLLPPDNTNLAVGGCNFIGLSITFERQHHRGADVFSRYTFAQEFRQFSLPPYYDYFAIDLVCKWRTSLKCSDEIPEPSPGTCPPPRKGLVTVNGEESKTGTIKVLRDLLAVGDFDPVSGIVTVPPCDVTPCDPPTVANSDGSYSDLVPIPDGLILPDVTHTDSDGTPVVLPGMVSFVATACPTTTVNGEESDVPTIMVTKEGVPVGTLDPETGNVSIPACPPSDPGEAYLVNTDGDKIGPAVPVASGASVPVTAPDGEVQVNSTGFGAVKSAGSLNVPVKDTNGIPRGNKVGSEWIVPASPLKFTFPVRDQYASWLVTADEAGPYNAWTDDGASGTFTYRLGGTGSYAAPSGTVTLVTGVLIEVMRTVTTAQGWQRWQRS